MSLAFKRVLFLVTGLGRGGAETQVALLAKGMQARGWQVRVVSMIPPDPEGPKGELDSAGIPVHSLGMVQGRPSPSGLWRLARLVKGFRPQVVHAHMIHANLLARVTRVMAPIPVLVCTAHSTVEIGRSFRSERATHLAYRLTDFLCDLTTQVSPEGVRRFLAGRAVPPGKLRYIPNGVDTTRFAPDGELRARMRGELGLAEDAFVWLAVGRLEEAKDYPTLLQAFVGVIRQHPEARLLVVGKGSLESHLRSLAQALGLEGAVALLGLRQDIPGLMAAADAFVMSSLWEGMPMVLLEAHAAGLPVVATDVGGNREVVQEGVTGYLVPPGDPDALAGAMLRMADLPRDGRTGMGLRGREWVEARFSFQTILDQWENVYTELAMKNIKR
ncbi:MAG: glycosyltransferase [Thermus sp.]|nr:glycosyltransferase [Thermus sp.]